MKTNLQIIGIVLICLFACAMSECDEDKPVEPEAIRLSRANLSSGSTIDKDTELTFRFSREPNDLTVNVGSVIISGTLATVSGPFKPGELNLVLTWEDGTQSFTYIVEGATFRSADPSPNSTLKAYQPIIVTFDGNPENVTVNAGTVALSGNKATITGLFEPGPLDVVIKWADGSKRLNYRVSDDPVAEILEVWREPNVWQDGEAGMQIHVKFKVANMKGITGVAAVYFYFKGGQPLRDFNGRFRTTDGNVSASKSFTPIYDFSIYDGMEIFMPYSELHLGVGRHELKFDVQVHLTPGFASKTSDWVHFIIQ